MSWTQREVQALVEERLRAVVENLVDEAEMSLPPDREDQEGYLTRVLTEEVMDLLYELTGPDVGMRIDWGDNDTSEESD